MISGPVRVRRPSDTELAELHEEQSQQEVTYEPVGMVGTRGPSGYRRDRAEVSLGARAETFNRAFDALVNWRAHTGAGFGVFPPTTVQDGATVVLYRRVAVGYITVCCRVVYMITESGRQGFAYGTLPLHLEEGEQAFVIEQDANGHARFVIESLSRPAHPVTRAAYPMTRLMQRAVTRAYLSGLVDAVDP